jgi:AcrR family transcriptional regulator
MDDTAARLSGRRAEAARNDERIRAAARAVFVADPGAPVSAVAKAAGVGVAALYRRYPSKEQLLRTLAAEGLGRYIAQTEAALRDTGDPWTAFAGWMRRVLEADTNTLAQRLAGTFTPTPELYHEAGRAHELTLRLLERAQSAGAVRPDLEVDDLPVLLEQLAGIRVGDAERTAELRRRYLALTLEAIKAPGGAALPGSPPSWSELRARWDT